MDSTTLDIRPAASFGESWLFDPLHGIMATVTSLVYGEALGQPDSLKIIQLSNGDSIVVSRDHGIIAFPGQDDMYVLLGIEGIEVGVLLPKMGEMFGYQPGDIVQYHLRHSYVNLGPGEISSDWQKKYHITDRLEFADSVRLEYTCLIKLHEQHWNEHELSYSYETGSWTLPGGPFPFPELASAYPGEVIGSSMWPTPYLPDSFHLAAAKLEMYGIDGGVRLSSSRFFDPNISLGQNAYAIVDSMYGRVEYREPFGFFNYIRHVQWETIQYWDYIFEMSGAVMDGDTTGVIWPDSIFTVGVDEKETVVGFHLTYSPWNETLSIVTDQPMTDLWIVDITGRTVMHRMPRSPTEIIDSRTFPSGVYLVMAGKNDSSVTSRRIAIFR